MFHPDDYDNIKMQQEIPDFQEEPAIPPAQNEEYGDFIIKYRQNIMGSFEPAPNTRFQIINEMYGVLYVPLSELNGIEVNSYSYTSIPKCFTYMDMEALTSAGINRLHNHPYLKLLGEGTAIAIIDSSVDYLNPVFRDGDRSRIAYLWDQTIVGNEDTRVPFGRLFTNEEINEAIASENPLDIVPSQDTNGHGTAMAGIAAGNVVPGENFSGAAPGATLIVIKLKPAKQYLREFFQIPDSAEIFQEDDIMLGISVAMKYATELQMPLSVCLGIGTSQGAHIGSSPLSQYLNYLTGFIQVSASVAAGNEGTARHHYAGFLSEDHKSDTAELRIGENEKGFSLECWGEPPEVYEVSIQSPTGETLNVSNSLGAGTQTLNFVFVETKVLVNYIAMERSTGNPLIYFRFFNPAAGVWRITLKTNSNSTSRFHMWLPVQGLISPDTYFLQSTPYNTVTTPGDSPDSITTTAYQYRDNSLYLQASRGFTPNDQVTPNIAAPGVGMTIPLPGGRFGTASGTSLAAAMTAGAAALIFEWAIIRGNAPFFPGIGVKYYLQNGAAREENLQYPNPDWGYGRMDLYHTFELIS